MSAKSGTSKIPKRSKKKTPSASTKAPKVSKAPHRKPIQNHRQNVVNVEKRHVNFNIGAPGIGIKIGNDPNDETADDNGGITCIYKQNSYCSLGSGSSKSSKSSKSVNSRHSSASSSTRRSSSRSISSTSHQNMHKVWMYESRKRRKTSQEHIISPYLCEVVKHPHPQKKPREYKEIYVTDREYKLLQTALKYQDARSTTSRRPGGSYRKTLFGYVNSSPAWMEPKNEYRNQSSMATAKNSRKKSPLRKTIITSTPKRDSSSSKHGKKHADSPRKSEPEHHSDEVPLTEQDMAFFLQEQTDEENRLDTILIPEAPNIESCNNNWGYINSIISSTGLLGSEVEKCREVLIPDLVSVDTGINDTATSPSTIAGNDTTQLTQGHQDDLGNFSEKEQNEVENSGKSNNTEKYESEIFRNRNQAAMSLLSLSCSSISADIQQNVPESCNNSSKRELQPSFLKNTPAQEMISSLLATSEASVILMNTLFKVALDDPNSLIILKKSRLFQKFVNVHSEIEALAKAGTIFVKTSESIDSYLLHLKDKDMGKKAPSPPSKVNPKSESISCIGENQSLLRDNCVDRHEGKAGEEAPFQDNSDNTLADSVSAASTKTNQRDSNWISSNLNANDDHPPLSESIKKMLPTTSITTSSAPGFLQQTIACRGYEFKLNFIGTSRTVKSLISSTKTKSKLMPLDPIQLIEMIDQTLPFIVVRLSTAKSELHSASQKMGTVVEEFTAGKHGRYSKTFKKAVKKLRGLNIFSGIILQMSKVFTSIFEKLQSASTILQTLQDILKVNQNSNSSSATAQIKNSLNGRDGIIADVDCEMIIRFVSDIENAIEMGKNSLAGIQSKTLFPSGENDEQVSVKKFLREIIEDVFQVALQFESRDELDFGSLIMSSICNTKELLSILKNRVNSSASGLVPQQVGVGVTVDKCIQRNIVSNLDKIQGLLRELCNISGRMTFVASFLATKSFLNLKRNKENARTMMDHKSQLKLAPWYKRRLFSHMVGKSYSLVSVPSPGSPAAAPADDGIRVIKHIDGSKQEDEESDSGESQVVRVEGNSSRSQSQS